MSSSEGGGYGREFSKGAVRGAGQGLASKLVAIVLSFLLGGGVGFGAGTATSGDSDSDDDRPSTSQSEGE